MNSFCAPRSCRQYTWVISFAGLLHCFPPKAPMLHLKYYSSIPTADLFRYSVLASTIISIHISRENKWSDPRSPTDAGQWMNNHLTRAICWVLPCSSHLHFSKEHWCFPPQKRCEDKTTSKLSSRCQPWFNIQTQAAGRGVFSRRWHQLTVVPPPSVFYS